MKIWKAAILALAVLAAPASAGAPSPRAVDAILATVYGQYAGKLDPVPDWERPVWSREMRVLFDRWQTHIGDHLTGLNDYGWFCECQDYDEKRFVWKRQAITGLAPGRFAVTVMVDPGWDRKLTQRLVLKRERRRWVIDDLISEAEPDGLKAALRREISEPVED